MGTASGHEKDYSKDPSKQEVRRRFLEFIEKSFKKNKHGGTRVLCLPGRDLLEFTRAYGNLPGIKPQNMTFVERDKVNARVIKAAMPEAEVFNGELLEFVEKTHKKFDVVSFDFCTNFTSHTQKIVNVLRNRNLLEDNAVVLIAVSAYREMAVSKELYRQFVELAALNETPAQSIETQMAGLKVSGELVEKNLAKIRSDAFSHFINCTFLGGPQHVYHEWFAENKNEALIKRVEEIALRTYFTSLVKNADHVKEDKGYGLRDSEPTKFDRLGIQFEIPGYKTNEFVEKLLKTVAEGKIIYRPEKSGVDVNTNEVHISEKTQANFRLLLWGSLGFLGQSECPEETYFLAMNLFKNSLLKIFQEDLRECKFRARDGTITLRGDGGLMFEYTFAGKAGVYWVVGMERYRYVSDSHCPMMVDMLRLTRAFQYSQIVTVTKDGRIVPYIPENILASGDGKRIIRAVEDVREDYYRFRDQLKNHLSVNTGLEYPERVEIVGEEPYMCDTCKVVNRENEILKKQLGEMRDMLSGSNRKVIRKALSVGDFDRKKVVELIQAGKTTHEIVEILKDTKITVGRVSAIRSWITMGGDDYIKKVTG